ncbi:MAG: hypothetical protein GOV15_02635 [Candidatus Diapherotrites archaeon]|nr:hypothetical protein [Candidatus Diapherotrites archaeon]
MRKIMIITNLLLLSPSVFAYIDPGTGGMIIGSMGPAILAFIGALLATFRKKIVHSVKKVFKKK